MRRYANISAITISVRTVQAKTKTLWIIADNFANDGCTLAEPEISKGYLFRNYSQGLLSVIILLTRNESAVGKNGREPEGLLAYVIFTLKSVSVFVIVCSKFYFTGY